MGTVTGRILVADPHLQNLRRKFRVVVEAEDGLKLVYLDYSQFEPGIAAQLSRDDLLIADYNNGDVYKKLSISVFGDEGRRNVAKRAFISFLYGMSEKNIGKLLLTDDNPGAGVDDKVAAFFSRYAGLRNFRSECQQVLVSNGRIGTLLGNYRHRGRNGDLNAKERRWAANQRVQGTASLILKEAMLSLVDRFGENSILLPIHDAVLLQLSRDRFDNEVAEARETMIKAFQTRCADISAYASLANFG